jgi:hypothetical protein
MQDLATLALFIALITLRGARERPSMTDAELIGVAVTAATCLRDGDRDGAQRPLSLIGATLVKDELRWKTSEHGPRVLPIPSDPKPVRSRAWPDWARDHLMQRYQHASVGQIARELTAHPRNAGLKRPYSPDGVRGQLMRAKLMPSGPYPVPADAHHTKRPNPRNLPAAHPVPQKWGLASAPAAARREAPTSVAPAPTSVAPAPTSVTPQREGDTDMQPSATLIGEFW